MTDDATPPGRGGALAALLLMIALVAGGYWLTHRLAATGHIEDCLMAGRRNCAPIQPN